MKLILIITHSSDADLLISNLIEKGFSATKLASTGGFLREGNATILVGVEDESVEDVMNIIKSTCKSRERLMSPTPPGMMESMGGFIPYPIKVQIGGATIFVLDVERFEKV
ncbi:MAG: cyclic-di-AMP receptor [bacterium]